jgi:hypothetical protein
LPVLAFYVERLVALAMFEGTFSLFAQETEERFEVSSSRTASLDSTAWRATCERLIHSHPVDDLSEQKELSLCSCGSTRGRGPAARLLAR